MTTKYLSIDEASKRTGIGRTTILYRIRADNKMFPQPDAIVNHGRLTTYGWLPSTINNYVELNKKEH